jgi:hypothetical protein
MRDNYDLQDGRPNPYTKRLGAKGRAELVRWWASVTDGIRVLPEDVARAFPDTETTVEALRLVMKLRELEPKTKRSAATRSARKRKTGTDS